MASLMCPKCNAALETAGYTQRCPTCDGAWIHEDALVGMLQERTSTLVFLPWHPRGQTSGQIAQERACPVCTKAMQTVNLEKVALDRCSEHGVWFDAEELAQLLAAAKHFKTTKRSDDDPEHSGLLGSIAKLFGG